MAKQLNVPHQNNLVRVRNLSVDFTAAGKVNHAVKHVSFTIKQGRDGGAGWRIGIRQDRVGALDPPPAAISRPHPIQPARSISTAAIC